MTANPSSPGSWLTFLLIMVVGGLAAGPFPETAMAATDKTPKPDDAFFSPPRVSFDCTARDTLSIDPGFYLERADSTTASSNNLPGYACRSWSEQGPENIYRLDLNADLELFAALRDFQDPASPPAEDLDIFLLSDCDTDSCLVGANLEFSIALAAGTYYLIVDGYGSSNPASGQFTLILDARELGVPQQVCDPGGAEPINPGVAVTPATGNLFFQPNLIQNYSCSSIVERGGELWYAVTLDPHHEFSVETTVLSENLDAALWLFDGCGPQAQCLGFADEKLSGEAEMLAHANDTDATVTVYLAVDSYRPPTSEPLGEMTVEFTGISNVPTVKRSLGSVRALYR